MTNPPSAQILAQAVVQYQAGRFQEAEQLCRRFLAIDPNNTNALDLLGGSLFSLQKIDEAIKTYRKLAGLVPSSAEAHNNLGGCLQRAGRIEEAAAEFKSAIALDPGIAAAHLNLGMALLQLKREDEALSCFQQAIAHDPNSISAHFESGNIFLKKLEYAQALEAFEKAVLLKPDYVDAIGNISSCLVSLGRYQEALAALRRVMELKPDTTDGFNNLGLALQGLGRHEEALAAFRKAVELNPSSDECHVDYAFALLLVGQFDIGWREWEHRLARRSVDLQYQEFGPRWDGSDPAGKTILLAQEQGFGDVIQFIRYAPLIAQRGGKVVLRCQSELQRILQNLPSIDRIVEQGPRETEFDFYCPIMSLGKIFGANLQNIPREVPYLFPDPALLESWRQKLNGQAGGIKVGLAWSGNPDFKGNQTRSMSLDDLAPLSQATGVTFFSLQKGAAAVQADRPPPGLRLVNLAPQLHDFADTAAVMCLMDLVITTDTSIPHLAGALGRPVWVMPQFMADWRWLLHREDSPWYPTMRLFRQTSFGDWTQVIGRVARTLEKFKLV